MASAAGSAQLLDELERRDADLDRRLERMGLEFLVDFHEIALRHRPDDPELLSELGQNYTRLGRYEEGLAVDRRLVELVPDNPTVHYNLGCSLALSGAVQPALDALELAVELGYADAGFMLEDEDLATLRQEPRFAALVETMRAAEGGSR